MSVSLLPTSHIVTLAGRGFRVWRGVVNGVGVKALVLMAPLVDSDVPELLRYVETNTGPDREITLDQIFPRAEELAASDVAKASKAR